MHIQARRFTEYVKIIFPQFFNNVKVLDVGSGDINGNNKVLFTDLMLYEGNDVAPGKNVTIVSPTSKLPFPDDMFDVIISTECFEHDPEWQLSLKKIYKMLKPGGLFCFTCASTGRPEHGTRRTSMNESFGCKAGIVGWTDYYLNLTIEHVKTVEPLEDVFSQVNCYYNSISHDLYFWGIKKTDTPTSYDVPSFTDKGVTQLV